MKLFSPDNTRRIEIPGVPGLVRRPVGIDQAQTGFTSLRTLRIYQFDPGSGIDGHAEEDEVFLVILSGSVELTMSTEQEPGNPVVLASAGTPGVSGCAAYLPPHAAYRLVPQDNASVAYVRATPRGSRPPKVFASSAPESEGPIAVLLDEQHYAEKLRLRLVSIHAGPEEVAYAPWGDEGCGGESLFHLADFSGDRSATLSGEELDAVPLRAGETVSIQRSEHPVLHLPAESSTVILVAFTG